jgi:uncharacterized protein CbrC (UPF0167 family)
MTRGRTKYPTNGELLAEVERRLRSGSIVAICRVRCGGCGATLDLGNAYPTEAEYVLRREGWNRRGTKHYCPTCMADGTANRMYALSINEEE